MPRLKLGGPVADRQDVRPAREAMPERPRAARRNTMLNQYAGSYLKARWFFGGGLIALTVLLYVIGVANDLTWVVGVTGLMIVVHAFAMTMWEMHEAEAALILDLGASFVAAAILGASGRTTVPALMTFVLAAVLIGLFSDGVRRVGLLIAAYALSFGAMAVAVGWRVDEILGEFLGSGFIVAIITGVIAAIRARLVELEAARAQTIGVVSHELRNHLAGVIGAAELVRDNTGSLTPEEVDELIGLAHQQAVEAGEVIEDLLIASRAERGVLDAIPELIDLCPVTQTVIRRTALEHRTILFDCAIPVWALADPLRYMQILRNLLTNALRYGGETVRVSVQSLGDLVSVVVADDGEGVDPADEHAIFEPYRGGRSMDHVSGSSGLGLWIARSLAEKMNGDLIYRRQGGQTLFELTLPAGEDPIDPATDATDGLQPSLLSGVDGW